jgi:site-specific recombinase XerD
MSKVSDAVLFGLVHDFLKVYLPSQRNSSPHTVKAYRTSLDLLFDFVKQQQGITIGEITFQSLNTKTVIAFLDWLEGERGCSINTRNQRLACIRAFFKYASDMDSTTVIHNIEIRKITKKKLSTPSFVEYMNETAVKALFAQPDIKTSKGLRNQFFMILMYDTAARIQEVLNLRIKDIHLGTTPTARLLGKGSKIRTVPLMERTVEHFQNYARIFHPGADVYSDRFIFYVIRSGEMHPMSDDAVLKFMKKYGADAKMQCSDVPDNVHPHLWRHSRAMHLYQSGMDLTLVSQWLGHASLETTLIYAHADTEQKRKAIEKATTAENPLREEITERFREEDEDIIKRLYGLK